MAWCGVAMATVNKTPNAIARMESTAAEETVERENPDAPADVVRLRMIRNDPMPRFTIKEHDVGFIVGGIARFLMPGDQRMGWTLHRSRDRIGESATVSWPTMC